MQGFDSIYEPSRILVKNLGQLVVLVDLLLYMKYNKYKILEVIELWLMKD